MNSWNSRSQKSIFLFESGKCHFVQITLFHTGIPIECLQGPKNTCNKCSTLPDLVKWGKCLQNAVFHCQRHQNKRQFAWEVGPCLATDRRRGRQGTKWPPKAQNREQARSSWPLTSAGLQKMKTTCGKGRSPACSSCSLGRKAWLWTATEDNSFLAMLLRTSGWGIEVMVCSKFLLKVPSVLTSKKHCHKNYQGPRP